MTPENQSKISEKLSPKKIVWVLCGIVLAIISICLFASQSNGSKFEANQNNPEDIAQAFAYSLAYNKLDNVKSYVTSDKWAFIDSWSTQHQPISPDCKDPNDVDLGPVTMSSYDSTNHSVFISFFFNQECPNYYYTFSVGGMLVELVDNKWQISEWDEICEDTLEEQCY
jgi:hypothetical protein